MGPGGQTCFPGSPFHVISLMDVTLWMTPGQPSVHSVREQHNDANAIRTTQAEYKDRSLRLTHWRAEGFA